MEKVVPEELTPKFKSKKDLYSLLTGPRKVRMLQFYSLTISSSLQQMTNALPSRLAKKEEIGRK